MKEKIDSLIEFAKLQGDNNVTIILLCLQGARIAGADGMLAAKSQEYTNDVLLPLVVAGIEQERISKN